MQTAPGWSVEHSPGSGHIARRIVGSVVGPAVPAEQQARAMRLSCLLREKQCHQSGKQMQPDRGVREKLYAAQVAHVSQGAEDRSAADTVESNPDELD